MQLTNSYTVFRRTILKRYEFAETRYATAVLQGTNPQEFGDIQDVLDAFAPTATMFTSPGRNQGPIPDALNAAFRQRQWRETGTRYETELTFTQRPWPAGAAVAPLRPLRDESVGHDIDNFHGRVALEVEWNAKDGNLDRDLANFRALHDLVGIDVGVIVTRHQARTYYAANYLADVSPHLLRRNAAGARLILLQTTTTTNLEKLQTRLARGDGGSCPVLAIAITDSTYAPAAGDPPLPPYAAPYQVRIR